jgi:hypothetical protein
MAGHDGDDFDPARLARMERRLQSLEDAEAIRNLKARYAALCDDKKIVETIECWRATALRTCSVDIASSGVTLWGTNGGAS